VEGWVQVFRIEAENIGCPESDRSRWRWALCNLRDERVDLRLARLSQGLHEAQEAPDPFLPGFRLLGDRVGKLC